MSSLALAQYGSGAAITALLHPFGFAKVLMQVGYEPIPPSHSTKFFSFSKEPILIGANIFRYMGFIKRTEGFFGLYRGVVPRVVTGTVGNLVQYNVQDKFKNNREQREKQKQELDNDDFLPWFKNFAMETGEETLARVCGVIVSHPFHVITLRCMVQFIGKESQYDSMWSSVKSVYETNGILGFFAGLVPRILQEVLTIWLTSFLTQMTNKYAVKEQEMKPYTAAVCGLMVSQVTYPFTLVSNVMAVNNSGLKAGTFPYAPIYSNWLDCFSSLSSAGELNRGAAMIRRVYKGPAPNQSRGPTEIHFRKPNYKPPYTATRNFNYQ